VTGTIVLVGFVAFGLVAGDEVGYFKAGTTTCGATTDAFDAEGTEIFCNVWVNDTLRTGSGIESAGGHNSEVGADEAFAVDTGNALLGLSAPVAAVLDAFTDSGAEIICSVGTMVDNADGAVVAASESGNV
jgi:hypothetical protein